jgi:LacI family transcriptional regulator
MITLKDLAKKLEVSISTVSKALNDSPEISEKTVARVKAMAKFYNYKPNQMALNLKKSRTHTIGVIIPNILNHFFAKTLYSIEKEATKHGYSIITCMSNESYKSEIKSLQLLANGSVDGFIISLAEETQAKNKTAHIEAVLRQKTPIVLFDRVSDMLECDKVISNDFDAAYQATKTLLKEGRKNIVLLSNIDQLSVGKLRTNGYLRALEDAKEYANKPIIVHISKEDAIEDKIAAVFAEHPSVDGVLAIDNLSGVIALNKAKELGFDIPKALSVIGFSDENILPFTNPKLTTVSQDENSIGKMSVKVLLNQINNFNKLPVETKIIETSLIKRGTTLE